MLNIYETGKLFLVVSQWNIGENKQPSNKEKGQFCHLSCLNAIAVDWI